MHDLGEEHAEVLVVGRRHPSASWGDLRLLQRHRLGVFAATREHDHPRCNPRNASHAARHCNPGACSIPCAAGCSAPGRVLVAEDGMREENGGDGTALIRPLRVQSGMRNGAANANGPAAAVPSPGGASAPGPWRARSTRSPRPSSRPSRAGRTGVHRAPRSSACRTRTTARPGTCGC